MQTTEIVMYWTVGTAPDCEVRITGDEYVSARHAAVALRTDGEYYARDLGSTNGTYIERPNRGDPVFGRRDQPRSHTTKVTAWTIIKPGDTLIIGRTRIPRGKS